MYKNRLRTYPIKSLTIFVGITFVISVAMVVLFAFLKDELMVIRVLVWIFCGLFSVSSGIILVYQLFFYIEVNEKAFIKHFPFGHESIPLNKIQKIRNKDGFYTIYVNDRKITSFATNTQESQAIIVFLEKHGVKIEW